MMMGNKILDFPSLLKHQAAYREFQAPWFYETPTSSKHLHQYAFENNVQQDFSFVLQVSEKFNNEKITRMPNKSHFWIYSIKINKMSAGLSWVI